MFRKRDLPFFQNNNEPRANGRRFHFAARKKQPTPSDGDPQNNTPNKNAAKKNKPKRGLKARLKRLGVILAALFGICLVAFCLVFKVWQWQRLDVSKIVDMRQSGMIYDNLGEEVTTLSSGENRVVVTFEEIPKHVRDAFVAAEDLRFYSHPGFDIIRMGGSLIANLKKGSYAEGASTITQQLIKLSHLSAEKSFSRKFQEIWLAWNLERRYSKNEILTMYLNYIYFGNRAYGIEQAAREYFHKGVSDLTVAEGAMLAATIKATSYYAPHINIDANTTRRDYILRTMRENNMIDEETYNAAVAEHPTVYKANEPSIPFGWFVDEVLTEGERLLGVTADELLSGGYEIYSTLDTKVQSSADKVFRDSGNFPQDAADGTKAQSAIASVDSSTGAILALEGGREYTTRRGLNRAISARRSPGSSLKPIAVYAPAIKLGYSTASILLDEQEDFGGGYSPRNSSDKYYGPTTMRNALALSLNVATVRLMRDIGVNAARDFLADVGIEITEDDLNLSLALGSMTNGVTPLEMAAAYAMLSNKGVYNAPYIIEKIIDKTGKVVYEHTPSPKRVLSEQNAYLMTSLLQSVTSWGTGNRLAASIVPVAGKTGTNSIGAVGEGNRDIWMATYTTDIATAVWMGFDKTDSAHKLPSWNSGGDSPALLTNAFLSAVYEGRETTNFEVPDGVVGMTIDTRAVALRGEIMLASEFTPQKYRQWEVFLSTNRPTRVSDIWATPKAPGLFYIEQTEEGYPRLVFTPSDNSVLRIERSDFWGGSVTVAEIEGKAGLLQTYTDDTAVSGTKYSYTITPINADLLAEGILLEGQPLTQTAQQENKDFLSNLAHLFQ